jgi:hypothetical protein
MQISDIRIANCRIRLVKWYMEVNSLRYLNYSKKHDVSNSHKRTSKIWDRQAWTALCITVVLGFLNP